MGGGMTPETHLRPPRPVWHTTKNSFTSCFDMSNIGRLLLVKRSYLFFFPIPLPFCVQSASRFILQGVYACVRKIRLWECAGREGCMTADSGSWNLPFPPHHDPFLPGLKGCWLNAFLSIHRTGCRLADKLEKKFERAAPWLLIEISFWIDNDHVSVLVTYQS